MDYYKILNSLKKCWSEKSSENWSEENPSRGQCSVTAIVIQDNFGGDIVKTLSKEGQWHYYNRINGISYDFTSDQFPEPLLYFDLPSNKIEALSDTSMEQYKYLSDKFRMNQIEL